MTLKEYKLDGRTFLFDSGDVPEGAELIGEIKESEAPGTFEALVIESNPLIAKREAADLERERVADLEAEVVRLTTALAEATKPAEPKQAAKPANKAAEAPATKA